MSSSFFVNLYSATNLYSSDTYYYYEEINHKVPRCDICVKDLRSNLCYQNESNKFFFRSPSSDIMEVRIQPNII